MPTPVLGSRSTDTMSGIGPAPLAAGQLLGAGDVVDSNVVGNPELQPEFPRTAALRCWTSCPAPAMTGLTTSALESLCGQDWVVTPRSNRVGMRLDGDAAANGAGRANWPAKGPWPEPSRSRRKACPVLFLADHPITGGYPVIGVVVDHQLDLAAQVPIGGCIRFRWAPEQTSPEQTSPEQTFPRQK